MIATEDLQLIRAIVETGTLGAAAVQVHLSQPAASRRVQALERRIGVRLFERSGRKLAITEAGREFFRRSIDMLDRMRDLETEMAAFGRGQRGVLRIGATVTVCVYLLPDVLTRMREQHPEYELFLVNERSSRLPDLVREGALDLGIASVLDPGQALTGLQRIEWLELHLGLLAPGLPDAASIRALEGTPIVASASGSLRAAVDRALAMHRVTPRIVAQADSLEVVRTLVACGFGRAIVPAEVMGSDGNLTVHPFLESIEPLSVACFYRRKHPPVQAFVNLLEPGGWRDQ